MRVEGRRSYAADRELLWSLLQDPLTLAQVFPGCEQVEAVSPEEFRVSLNMRVGQSIEPLIGVLHLDRRTPYQRIDFHAGGESPNGDVVARGHVSLESQAAGDTSLGYEMDIDVTGGLALISPRMLQTTARAFARRCLDGLEKQVAIRTRVYTTSVRPFDAPEAVTPPSIAPRQPVDIGRVLALLSILLAVLSILRAIGRGRARRLSHQQIEPSGRAPETKSA